MKVTVVRDPIRAIEYKYQFVGQQETGFQEISPRGLRDSFHVSLAEKHRCDPVGPASDNFRFARDSGGTGSRNYGLLHYADFPVLILGAHLDYILIADKN